MDNIKIDFLDLIRRILQHWKFVVIVTLICGLLFEGIGYARAYFGYRQEAQGIEKENITDWDYISLEENLSKREINEVQTAVAAYQVYMEQYEEDLLYCQDSIKMQLDVNHVPIYIMHYGISGSDSNGRIANNVVKAAVEIVKDEEACEEIRTTLGWDTELGYIDNLISVETEDTLNINDETMKVEVNDPTQVEIEIMAPEKEDCLMIAEILKSHIVQETTRLQEYYGEFEWILMDETYIEKASTKLRDFQVEELSRLNVIRNAITALSTGMTDDQKDYYYELIEYSEAESNEEEIFIPDENTAVSLTGLIRWRFILLGLVLGLILACGYLLIRYILAKNLRVKDDLEDVFHIPILGSLHLKGKKQRFTWEEQMEMICTGIRIVIKKTGLKSVYLTGTSSDKDSDQVMEQIKTFVADTGIKISSGKDVACDPASLEQMTASDGVLFVERVDCSPYADIQKEVEYCQMFDVPVIGSVVIE